MEALLAANARFVREAVIDEDARSDGRRAREPRDAAVACTRASAPPWHDTSLAAAPAASAEQDPSCVRAESRLGRTRVIATLAAAIGAPPIDRAHEGQLAIHVDSSAAEGVGAELAVELGRTLEQLLRHARAVDLESLCIVPARAAWCLRMDVRVVHNDGALMDACALAALAAAKAFRRPEHRVRSRTGASSVVDVIPLHAR